MLLPIHVVAFETDFGCVVSNTRYLEYIERGRYALLHSLGLRITDIWDEHGVQPVVRRVEVDYLGFAHHENELLLRVGVVEHTRATTILEFELKRQEDVLMRARQTLAYLNRAWKPTRVPPIYRDALKLSDSL